jgi:LysM repeat protein
MICTKKKIIICLMLFSVFIFPRSAGAINTATIGIWPGNPDPKVSFSDSWLIYNLDLGQKKTDAVVVKNVKEETVVIKLYAVDATTTSEGTFALLPEDAERKDVGSWVKLPGNEFEIAPGTEVRIPFTIEIPPNADAGDHMGGIITQEIETAEDNTQVGNMGIKIISRVGLRIYETVPGEVKKGFEITRFDWKMGPSGIKSIVKDILDINQKTFFFTGIKNKGNVRISPRITIDVKNIFGMTVAHIDKSVIESVFPRGEIEEGAVTWNGMPYFGRYKVTMTTEFAEEGVGKDTRELIIWAVPYRIIFLLLIFSIIFVLFRLIKIYFQEAKKEKMPIYTVNLGDNLADIASKFAVPWKKLAKLNYIGKPYEIRQGEKLFIPVNRKNKIIINQARQVGDLAPSIFERSGNSKLKKKRVLIVVISLILIGGGSIWVMKKRQEKMIHQEYTAPPQANQEPKKETTEKTAAGAFKKSSVNVQIVSITSNDQDSSGRLFKKFELMGYKVSLSPETSGKYTSTTIEYDPMKKEQAEMVKNDLGVKDQNIDMKEVADLGANMVIYNKLDKNIYFPTDFYLGTGASPLKNN